MNCPTRSIEMTTRPRRRALATVRPLAAAGLLVAACAPWTEACAQVPPGWCVVSADREPNGAYPGDAGIYLTHPRTPMSMYPIAGLPPDLTAVGLPSSPRGANCVLLHESGDLLVAAMVDAGVPVDLCRIQIVGDPAIGFSAGPITRINLGEGRPGVGGFPQQLAFVTPDVVLVAGYAISGPGGSVGPMGAPGPVMLATVNLTTNTVAPIPLPPVPFPPNVPASVTPFVLGVTFDETTATVSFGVYADTSAVPTLTPATSWVCSFALASPQVVTAGPTFAGRVNNLATRHLGTGSEIIIGGVVGASTLRPVLLSQVGGVLTPLLPNGLNTQWDNVSAVAVEPSTGQLMLCGTSDSNNAATGGVHWMDTTTGAITTLSNTLVAGQRGPLSGIAVAPSLVRSEAPTAWPAAAQGHAWSDASHPDKLPVIGNTSFFVEVERPPGTTPFLELAVLGFQQLPGGVQALPQCPTLLLHTAPLATLPARPSAVPGRTGFALPLPPGLQPMTLYLQGAHILTTGAIHATDLLRIDLL